MARQQPTGWVGWVYFAGILMVVRGLFQALEGILALLHTGIYVTGSNNVVTLNLTAWGWIHIALGIVLLTGAASVFSGRWWGRIVGSIMIGLSLVANLAFLPAYPIWGITSVVVDILILYALLVRGSEASL